MPDLHISTIIPMCYRAELWPL